MPTTSPLASEPLLKTTKEQSCASCRTRKLRCTGDRPACKQCLKSSASRGYPPGGIICLYSAASKFARVEDVELEAKLGKAHRCHWSLDPAKSNAGASGECEGAGATESEGDEDLPDESGSVTTLSCRSFGTEFWKSGSSSPSSPSASSTIELSSQTTYATPLAFPAHFASPSHDATEVLCPEIDWDDCGSGRVLQIPIDAFNVPIPSAPPSSFLLSRLPPLPSLPIQSLDSPTAVIYPSHVDASFWSYGPIARQEILEWEGLRYVGDKIASQ